MANGQVGGPGIPQTEANPPGGMIPFRRATTFRTSRLPATVNVMTAAQQNVQQVVDGSGYMYAVDIDVACVTAGNAAAVAYAEDAPYSSLASVVLGDVNGELINVDGISLYFANIYGGFTPSPLQNASLDPTIYALTAGAGATGGSFRFHLYAPVALNRRSLVGLVANQDRAQKYTLRTDVAGSAAVYTVNPTALGTVTINRTYENYAVPAAANANGASQQQTPPKFGVLHFITQSVNPTPPAPGTQNHYLPRLGNTIRYLILVFRSGAAATPRAAAEAAPPTQVTFKLGDTVIFTESFAYRRRLMRDRFGFDAPAGVLVYDNITDVIGRAGYEMGDDWQFTNGLVNAQFEIAYPAGAYGAGSSLTVITDDLQIPPNVDIYAPDF